MDNLISGISNFFQLAPNAINAALTMVAATSAITALTPTPRDDTVIGKIYKILELLALNFGHAKEAAPNKIGGRFTAPDLLGPGRIRRAGVSARLRGAVGFSQPSPASAWRPPGSTIRRRC